MDELAISVEELLEGARSVSKGLETLRGEHETFLSETNDTTEEGTITIKILVAVRGSKRSWLNGVRAVEGDERDRLDKESKEAVLSESVNRLKCGLDDANVSPLAYVVWMAVFFFYPSVFVFSCSCCLWCSSTLPR